MSSDTLEIPVVDLEDLSSSRPERQRRAAEALLHGFGFYGLVYIRNHGIDAEALNAFYDSFIRLTNLPIEQKQALGKAEIWYQRGWTPPNTEQAVVAGGQPDFKECYFMAPEPLDPAMSTQYPQIYCENVWPDAGFDDFKDTYQLLGHQLHSIGLSLLRGAAQALGLTPYAFEASTHGGPHVTRALRYLPLKPDQVGTGILWGEEHTDFNLLTLLPGGPFLDPQLNRCAKPDSNAGLYLRTRPTPEHPHGQMVQGQPPAGCIVAQVGQELEILTGGTLLATPHVIRAPKTPGYSRLAMAHFIHLHSMQILTPLEQFRTEETLRAYSPPVLAGTYSTKTLVDIGLAPREALNQLGYRHYDRLGTIRAEEDGQ